MIVALDVLSVTYPAIHLPESCPRGLSLRVTGEQHWLSPDVISFYLLPLLKSCYST